MENKDIYLCIVWADDIRQTFQHFPINFYKSSHTNTRAMLTNFKMEIKFSAESMDFNTFW